MDGELEWSSGFAARPLAAAGFVVLQTYNFANQKDHDEISTGRDKRFGTTPEQSHRHLALLAFEGAIDYLDRRGIIDKNRVGISGFSRTVAFVTYTLTHTKYNFRAAVLTDGADGGYFQRLAFPSGASDDDAMNGGVAPFGEGLKTWAKESPSFNLDKVDTAVRLVAIGKASILQSWEWFSALRLQNKPVDFVEIPDGVHLLEQPWDRRIAMQGMVDWFCFWLKGKQDSDPAKTRQYERWRELKRHNSLDNQIVLGN
jgi:dipeptidyl aminopeptidase/acylaminoacyl peptidase